MFALGIIGEYLARIHFRAMDRPPYAVREQIRGHAPSFESVELTEDESNVSNPV
jgi:hypothetical protein